MLLRQLLEVLSAIERRYNGQLLEVEARDSDGFLMGDFDVKTEHIIFAKRITVRFDPKPPEFQALTDTCSACQEACSSDCKCWCHNKL